ncbi:hypothetical protein [Flavobacterium sp. SLB02]|uniref:hypothetical protein n=1 Tax=Flavobacterium sp. SLB02 TaxID=2665645 RepID=UPI0012A81783|nr:hypothetical protein [Flavobacterium sp. SLB02]QGK73197.1 hypothetical protein GIY83_03700 [Flavobacterium sp. SLB02]
MKKLEILSPIILDFDLENGMACKISHQMYSESKSGFKIPVPFSFFMHLTEKNAEGKFIMPLDGDKIFGKEVIAQLDSIKTIMSKCAQLGEILNGKLRAFNNKHKINPELKNIYSKYDERYDKMDFMGHRNLFSDILKSKKLQRLNTVISEYNAKSVTKTFNDFIFDRNKYTHGDLMYWYPNGKTLLEYRDEKGKIAYGELNQDIFSSYLLAYEELNKFLDKLDK